MQQDIDFECIECRFLRTVNRYREEEEGSCSEGTYQTKSARKTHNTVYSRRILHQPLKDKSPWWILLPWITHAAVQCFKECRFLSEEVQRRGGGSCSKGLCQHQFARKTHSTVYSHRIRHQPLKDKSSWWEIPPWCIHTAGHWFGVNDTIGKWYREGDGFMQQRLMASEVAWPKTVRKTHNTVYSDRIRHELVKDNSSWWKKLPPWFINAGEGH